MTTVDAGRRATNRLPAALPPAVRAHLLPRLEAVALDVGQVLCRSGEPIAHASFPLAGAVSLLTPLEDGAAIEVGLVGREGLVGLSLVLGGDIARVAQVVACSRRHPARRRCAAWLLLAHDRADGDRFPLTHRALGAMLGVRRAAVTEATGARQRTGAIAYAHSRVTVRDRARLEAAACACYRVLLDDYARLLG
jgi:CRP-like cAMP-binding protein